MLKTMYMNYCGKDNVLRQSCLKSCCAVICQVDVDIATHISVFDDGPDRR